MKLSVLALDYDGTIASADEIDPSVRIAIVAARARGILVLLVTGRILDDLRRVAGDLHFVDGVIAENGAVVLELWDEMKRRGVLNRTAMVFGQMKEPPGARFFVGLAAMTVAEYFRDEERKDVLLVVDNLYRHVQAGMEVSGLLGRLPSRVGYQPTLAADIAGARRANHGHGPRRHGLAAGDLRARRRLCGSGDYTGVLAPGRRPRLVA